MALLLSAAGHQKWCSPDRCGFAEVLPDRVTVLAEYAEKPESVDKTAAQQQLDEGKKAMQEAGQDPARYDSARLTVLEAEAKLGTPAS